MIHRGRVADLCGRVARSLSIDALAEFALTLAASVHCDRPVVVRRREGAESNTPHPESKSPSFESLVVEMAETILHGKQGKSYGRLNEDLELSTQILEASDELDDAVEFAAYEAVSITEAMQSFFRNAVPRLDGKVVEALRQATTPRMQLTLTGQLPVLPAAAAKLMRTSAEAASVFELESIASTDPVLAGHLLGASNSAFFGTSSEIRSLRQAILRLGVPFARKALMEACFGPLFASSTLAELWRHSKLVAATAHELAGDCGFDQEVAYVAGLLHDIGRLVMHRCPPGIRVDEADRLAAGFPRVYAETLIYGADHAAVGGELLKRWSLPSEIIDAVTYHHRPESTDSALAAILYLAEDDVAADTLASENLSPGMRRAVAAQVAGLSGFSRGRIDRSSPIFALAC
jgi:putative nucleotidyltransferase with HDIG domain